MPRPSPGLWELVPLSRAVTRTQGAGKAVHRRLVAPGPSQPLFLMGYSQVRFLYSESLTWVIWKLAFQSWVGFWRVGAAPHFTGGQSLTLASWPPLRGMGGILFSRWAGYFISLCLRFLICKMGPVNPPAVESP